jgi:hypothetical protein
MIAALDISWQRFGRLVAVTRDDGINSNGVNLWRCLCDCGNYKIASVHDLRRGKTTSCGCAKRQRVRELGKAHVRQLKTKSDAELIGKLFGTWVAIGREQNRPSYFLVRCEQCRKGRVMRGDRIRQARSCLCASGRKTSGSEAIGARSSEHPLWTKS